MGHNSITEQAHTHYDAGVPFEIPMPTKSLYFLLSEAAHRYPNQIAIDYYGKTWTYAQLHTEVLKAAQVLHDSGVRKGDTVAIALPNCPQHFVAFYAVLRLGAVASEHNPLAPLTQISGQLSKNGAHMAIVWEKAVPAYEDINRQGGKIFSVDLTSKLPLKLRLGINLPIPSAKAKKKQIKATSPDYAQSWDKAVKKSSPLDASAEHAEVTDTAVILHTGGTNGIPKSVPLTHKNLGANVNQNIFWVWKLHESAETFWSLLPYFHAFGLTFFLLCSVALAGTQIVLPNFDVNTALARHKRRNVTFFVGVPPMFDRIAKAARKQGCSLRSIKYAISGGMPLSNEIAQLWEDSTGNYLIEGYGMSETSPTICGSPLNQNRRRGTLGIPFPSTQVKLVNPQNPDQEVASGEAGEILVKGPQVFSGYLDEDEENQRVFHQEWLRTGDIARNEDGYLVMVSRLKEMIISSGFNIYPAEVEKIFMKMPGIKNCAAVGLPDPKSGEKLVLAIIPENSIQEPLTLNKVRKFGETYLPHYALPKAITFFESLPVSQLGKVLRHSVRDQIAQNKNHKLNIKTKGA